MESKCNAVIYGEFTIKFTEVEARALEAIAGYGTNNFLKLFYEHMGKAYLEPHEQGVKTLFEDIKKSLGPQLLMVDKARKAFYEV